MSWNDCRRTRARRLISAGAIAMLIASAAFAERVRLSTGEVLTVEILSMDEQSVRLVHPVLGEIVVPREKLTILPAEDIAKADTDAATLPVSESESPLLEPVPTSPWSFKFVLAGAYSTGNTENASLTAAFTGQRETPRTKLIFDLGYFYAESGGERSDNRFSAGIRHDWLNVGSRWFIFADGRFEYDEFQAWEERISAHVGPGYHLVLAPPLRLDGLTGVGYVKEFGSDNDNWRPELQLGLDGEWTITGKQTLTFSTFFYPDLDQFGEFRWTNAAAWTCLLDEKTRLSLTAGVTHEYQSKVDDGKDHNDLRIYAGVQLEF